MNTKDEIIINKENNLSELMLELKKYFNNDELKQINLAYMSFSRTLSFFPEIWDRIRDDILLRVKNIQIEAKIHDSMYYQNEEIELSEDEENILKMYKKHKNRLNLDVEDWFIHMVILFTKIPKIVTRFYQLIAKNEDEKKLANGIKHKSFNEHINSKDNRKIMKKLDIEYVKIIDKYKEWYMNDVKYVRDKLIQHETIPRFWGSSTRSTSNEVQFSLSKFRSDELFNSTIYNIRDQYSEVFPDIKDENNYFKLLRFFETNIEKLDPSDMDRIKGIRNRFGRDFPDIPKSFEIMSNFISSVNSYFLTLLNDGSNNKNEV
jgi:hypothetical protein